MMTSPARYGTRCMRMKIAWMLAGGMRWNALVCSSVVIQSSLLGALPSCACSSRDLVGAGLVPGDHHVEQLAVDREVADLLDGARGHAARNLRVRAGCAPRACRRGSWRPCARLRASRPCPPTSQKVRLSVSPSLKSVRPGGHRAHADFLGERGEVFALQAVERRESLEQLNAGFAFFSHVSSPTRSADIAALQAASDGSTATLVAPGSPVTLFPAC